MKPEIAVQLKVAALQELNRTYQLTIEKQKKTIAELSESNSSLRVQVSNLESELNRLKEEVTD